MGQASDDLIRWHRRLQLGGIPTPAAKAASGTGRYIDRKLGIFQERPHLSRKDKKRNPGNLPEEGAAERERARRRAQSGRSTILAGALGPAATGRSILGGY